MYTRLLISSVAEETGALLKQYLEDRGVYNSKADAAVSYGYPTRDKPNLNGVCARGKIFNMRTMNDRGIRTVPWFPAEDAANKAAGYTFPLLARNNRGHGGTDIVPVFQAKEIPWRIAAGWEWFSSYVPIDTELRVWIFRGEHLGTYEKVMARPTDYKYIGRNFRNGFEFTLVRAKDFNKFRGAVALAADAVRVLDLDFAAVDLIIGEDGLPYILEVNTAPGVLRSHAEPTLALLADYIADWITHGYPER